LPVPLGVVAHLFGIPAGDHPRLVAWGRAMVANGDPEVLVTEEQRAAARRAEREFGGYIARLVLKRRRAPGDDFVSALARADVDGEQLAIDELIANAGFFFVNGYHNTVNLVANGLLALLRHPDQLALLRRDRSVVPNAVQELLRYDSPIQSIARVIREPYMVGGQPLDPGTAVMAMVAAAHRDPAAFPDPDTLRVDRPLPQRVLSFGAGPHYCVGAALARCEVELLFAEIIRRFPGLSLAGPPQWAPTFTLRGLDRLPVRLYS
jgi:cytochrome P450